MEPSLIYSANKSLKYKINWIKLTAETEWIYFGAQNETDKPLVIQSINEYFTDTSLYLVLDRKESCKAEKYEIGKVIEDILGSQNFFIWDTTFKKVIEFSPIGVMRRGYIWNFTNRVLLSYGPNIRALRINNYKAICTVEMNYTRINVSAGEPNVGMMNILESSDVPRLLS